MQYSSFTDRAERNSREQNNQMVKLNLIQSPRTNASQILDQNMILSAAYTARREDEEMKY